MTARQEKRAPQGGKALQIRGPRCPLEHRPVEGFRKRGEQVIYFLPLMEAFNSTQAAGIYYVSGSVLSISDTKQGTNRVPALLELQRQWGKELGTRSVREMHRGAGQ